MGVVFSNLASCFMFLGEFISTLFLAAGEIGSVLSRGIFGLIVGICDVLAACMCCFRVPFQDRPDRDGYTYSTLAITKGISGLDLNTTSRFSKKDSKITDAIKEKDTADGESISKPRQGVDISQVGVLTSKSEGDS